MRTRLMTGLAGLALTLAASALVPRVALAADRSGGPIPIEAPAIPR